VVHLALRATFKQWSGSPSVKPRLTPSLAPWRAAASVSRTRAPNNEVYVWLDHATVAKLRHLRGPGQSFSDAILRLVEDVAAER